MTGEGYPGVTGTTEDLLLRTISRYRVACAEYNAANAPDDRCDELAAATYAPFHDALTAWQWPARTREGALAALELAMEELANFDNSALAPALIRAAHGFFKAGH